MAQKLPLSAITCRDYLQQRSVAFIENEHDLHRQQGNLSSTIAEVKNALLNGLSINLPLDIHEVDGVFLLVDGHHRYQGALAYCKETKVDLESYQVPVHITKNSTERAAIDASFKMNLNHGVGLTPSEIKQIFFRRYVWSRSVPKLTKIMADTRCSKATASYIANAARWCLECIELKKVDIGTPSQLKTFMTDEMSELGITSNYLDEFGLPSYSLLRKALNGEDYAPAEVNGTRKERINTVRNHLEYIERKYGADILREGLRKHKTKEHGIKVSQGNLWLNDPATASLRAKPLDDGYGF